MDSCETKIISLLKKESSLQAVRDKTDAVLLFYAVYTTRKTVSANWLRRRFCIVYFEPPKEFLKRCKVRALRFIAKIIASALKSGIRSGLLSKYKQPYPTQLHFRGCNSPVHRRHGQYACGEIPAFKPSSNMFTRSTCTGIDYDDSAFL